MAKLRTHLTDHTASEARERLLVGLPVEERRLKLNGITTAVLEGGEVLRLGRDRQDELRPCAQDHGDLLDVWPRRPVPGSGSRRRPDRGPEQERPDPDAGLGREPLRRRAFAARAAAAELSRRSLGGGACRPAAHHPEGEGGSGEDRSRRQD